MEQNSNNNSRILISALLLILIGIGQIFAGNKPVLKFPENGKFKIVQFTDVHLKIENKGKCDSAIEAMKMVLKAEKPDFVILTGDIVTCENVNVKEGWRTVTKPMIDAGIPWAVVFGNHDHERGFTNKELMDYIETLPLNLSSQGPKNIHGAGNYVLPVKGSKSNKIAALLYCFDSNAYPDEKDNKELGGYDWIKFDQIAWYRSESKKFTEKNDNKPYPALAFFHIPLPEYNVIRSKKTTVGDIGEDVCCPNINSGLFNAFYESKDVMGVFCGHDHSNNYIGTFNKIALAYGCKTGYDAYGKFPKGGRIIVLYEGERKFDTWIYDTKETKKYPVTYPDAFIEK